MESILTSIKKLLNIAEDYEYFDTDIIIHVNSTFSALTQIGVGPTNGFIIKDKTAVWSDFIPENHKEFESVKTYIYLKVRLIFDPPANSSAVESINKIINEIEWRLNFAAEQLSIDNNKLQNG